MAGIGTFSLTVLLYFLRPPLEWLFEKIFPGWLDISIFFEMMYEGDHFLHGMLILLYCMALVLRARIQSIYENAKKTAKKLKQLSDSLEQLVQERTKELEQANEHLRASMKKRRKHWRRLRCSKTATGLLKICMIMRAMR